MHNDRDNAPQGIEGGVEADETYDESTLRWLLEMDMSEPEERVFTVEGDGYIDAGLSEYEAEVAGRPMVRGRANADDLSTYVEEEIVISSDTHTSDIYASCRSTATPVADARYSELMAVDWSGKNRHTGRDTGGSLEDGADVLGLADDDDIGEKALVLKRLKPGPAASTAPAAAAVSQVGPAAQEIAAQVGINGAAGGGAAAPAQVDGPAAAEVAGAEPPVAARTCGEGQAAVVRGGDLSDYLASAQPPADEAAFDDYLLSGGQLGEGGTDFDSLTVAGDGGACSVDPTLDAAIDYHEDFREFAQLESAPVSTITPVIAQLMEEISAAVGTRLAALQMPGEALRIEVMLGSDTRTISAWQADGYEPVLALGLPPLPTLRELGPGEAEAIFVRLVPPAGGPSWNRLFSDDFAAATTVTPRATGEGESHAVGDIHGAFGEDLLAADLEDDFAPSGWQPGETDIDALFDELGPLEEANPNAAMVAQLDEAAPAETGEFRVFDEDIFAGELPGEMVSSAGASGENIEALFEGFGRELEDGEEICGLPVDEFAGTESAARVPSTGTVAALKSAPAEAAQASPGISWCIPGDIRFNYASRSGTELFADFLDAFIEEGSSELEKLEDAVSAWEGDTSSESAHAAVTRTLHTIKGIAKGVGLQYYGTLIHNFETLLEALPRPEQGAEGEYFRIVNAWLDAAVRGLDHICNNRADIRSEFPADVDTADVDTADVDTADADAGEQPPAATVRQGAEVPPAAVPGTVADSPVAAQPRDARQRQLDKKLADEGAKVLAAQQSVRITSEKLDQLLNLSNQAQQFGVRTAQSTARGKRACAEMLMRLSSVRAHIADIANRALFNVTARKERAAGELDALEMDQYTELQEAANILREGVEDLADLIGVASRQNGQVETLLKQQARVISSIGSAIRAARVVPVSRLMPGLRRLVRTVSTDLGKTVSFGVLNEVGTLDRDDYARCQIILEHMVRNALDHGIESREERLAAGKPAAGQITIDVRKTGADAVIVLGDDGRGIDPEKLRESALRKGLDVDVDALSDDEALRLIFHKGFSTASTVSQISGRGVGMDIVISELQQMGGDIRIDSRVGQGTSFTIRIPSNVTVNGALLVTAGAVSYAIPLGGLIAVEQVPVEEFFAAVEAGATMTLAGMECEPAYLGTICRGESLPERSTWGVSIPVIVAGSDERCLAIAIDDVKEALELVIRSLGSQFATVPGLAGAATTADGEAVVALDLNLLVARLAGDRQARLSIGGEKEEGLLALVVDDSRTQRMVTTSQLETVGVQTVTAEHGGAAIDLLNTAERLPDIVLLDVEMPVKDGIQTLREIRKSVRYGHLPVIMVTSRTGLKHRTLAEASGCNGYMGKPFNFRMLVGQINELTGHRLQLA